METSAHTGHSKRLGLGGGGGVMGEYGGDTWKHRPTQGTQNDGSVAKCAQQWRNAINCCFSFHGKTSLIHGRSVTIR